MKKKPYSIIRILGIVIGLIVLILIYTFQKFNFLVYFLNLFSILQEVHPNVIFIFNKTFRLILNDLTCMFLIWVMFYEQKYLRLALFVLGFELILLLPLYFWIKLSLEGDSELSSPLLSQVHRLIVNPTLMILVMVSFIYQRFKERKT